MEGEITPQADLPADMHPLENPLILSHLFNLCPRNQLENFRLVCKQWNSISLPYWRSSFPLRFGNNDAGGQTHHIRSRNWLTNPTLPQFLKFVDNPINEYDAKPYRDFYIRHWDFGMKPDDDKLLERFWKAIAPGVTKLMLERCTFANAGAFRKVIFQRFPNLQHLTIKNCSLQPRPSGPMLEPEENNFADEVPVSEENRSLRSLSICHTVAFTGEVFPVSPLELLRHFPWITHLEYSGPRFNNQVDYYGILNLMLRAIRTVREGDKRKFPLKHFDCTPVMIEICDDVGSHETLKLLRELRLPLRSLKFCVKRDMDMNAAKNALDFHKETIRKIFIDQDEDLRGMTFNRWKFPLNVGLNNLREMLLKDVLLDTMTFLKYTPNLETLSIYDTKIMNNPLGLYSHMETMMVSRTPKGELANVRLLKLKEFKLEYEVTEDDMGHLAQWMPNIQNLTMILNEKQFEIVCQNLKCLEELRCLSGTVLTDQMICGRRFPPEEENGEGVAPEEIETRPNITNLQNLKTINCREGLLTDVSVFHGFIHLPKLTYISLEWKHMDFGVEARKALRDRQVKPFSFDWAQEEALAAMEAIRFD